MSSTEGVIDGRAVVEGFRTGALQKRDWNHVAHLVVAMHYVLTHRDPWTALCFFKPALIALNEKLGIENSESAGYHETITVFWILQLHEFVRGRDIEHFDDLVVELLASELVHKRYIYKFYGPLAFASPMARAIYVAP